MRTAEQAREMAVTALRRFAEVDAVLVDSLTRELEAGWVYYYQSAQFIETGDLNESLVGNAPLFVSRSDTPAAFMSYHRPIGESMKAFAFCGDVNAPANPEVEIIGWLPGALKVSATQAIRGGAGLGLAAAKELIDHCLEGTAVRVRVPSVSAARELASELTRLHFIARLTYGDY